MLATGLAIIASAACSSSSSSSPRRHAAAPPRTDTCATAAPPAGNTPPYVPVDGKGAQIVTLPPGVSLPAIVHANYAGTGTFVVKSRTADAVENGVLAVSNGPYDGTFPVGFVDPRCAPTAALDVVAAGAWHLDIARANRAPHLLTGLRGVGDAVLAYCGDGMRAHITHAAKSPFLLRTFGTAEMQFTRGAEVTDATIEIPRGPLFIAVTTMGTWSIAPLNQKPPPPGSGENAGACSS